MNKMYGVMITLLTVIFVAGCTSNGLFEEGTELIEDIAEDKVKEAVSSELDKAKDTLEDLTTSSEYINDEGDTFTTKIQYVTDGDTVKISCDSVRSYRENSDKNLSNIDCDSHDQATIRILNIDTPEVHGSKAPQEYGKEASTFAKSTLDGKTVTIELSEKDNPTDKYNRILAYVWVGDTMYQEMVVREGLARVAYLYEPDTKYADNLKSVENKARNEKKNIWSIDGYTTSEGFDMSVIN